MNDNMSSNQKEKSKYCKFLVIQCRPVRHSSRCKNTIPIFHPITRTDPIRKKKSNIKHKNAQVCKQPVPYAGLPLNERPGEKLLNPYLDASLKTENVVVTLHCSM